MRYNFISNNGDNYPVEKMCKYMKVSEKYLMSHLLLELRV